MIVYDTCMNNNNGHPNHYNSAFKTIFNLTDTYTLALKYMCHNVNFSYAFHAKITLYKKPASFSIHMDTFMFVSEPKICCETRNALIA